MKPALIKYSDESEESSPSAWLPTAMAENKKVTAITSATFFMNPLPTCLWNLNPEYPLAKLLKSPGDSCPDGAAHHGRHGVDELWNKLDVLVIQQILPADGNGQAINSLPAEVRVQRVIAGNIQAGKPVDVSKSHVMLQMQRQV